ncbi:MAG: FGGY-family carbohydrate kinase [Nanoarchaeota archaeon]|nr:FGGY-family carbohydrate kinase [Nanoarchaeota archaeon]
MPRLSLGLDSSTQKLQAIVIDIDTGEKVFDHSLDYRRDPRLNRFEINENYILPPLNEGEASQPPLMFFASLDAMSKDTPLEMRRDIVVINTSGQQHGHVYLVEFAHNLFDRLRRQIHRSKEWDLAQILGTSLAYDRAPIWMTSDTVQEADEIRELIGGKQRMIELSGSDSPLRFTGAVIRKTGKRNFGRNYIDTKRIQLIGNLIPAVLTGNTDTPADFANACGMSLMDYRKKEWSNELIEAVSKGLTNVGTHLRYKLPKLTSPDSVVGNIAEYFVKKYDFNENCQVVAGSGDNPQSKVLVSGDLLSLGTSFVNMTSTDGNTFDMQGFANAMYDGVGRPFIFGCRTNGAMVWDMVRADYSIAKEDYASGEKALARTEVGGKQMFFLQPRNESFPVSGIFKPTRIGYGIGFLPDDYNGIIESSLAAVYTHSKSFTRQTNETLYVTGGATASPEIMRRVAAMWNRPVIPIEKGGAALGAAVAGAYAYLRGQRESADIEVLSQRVLRRREPIYPRADDVNAYHGENGYLKRFETEEARLISANPVK